MEAMDAILRLQSAIEPVQSWMAVLLSPWGLVGLVVAVLVWAGIAATTELYMGQFSGALRPSRAGALKYIGLALLTVFQVVDSVAGYLQRQEQIRQLTTVVRHLEEVNAVAEIDIISLENGTIEADIRFKRGRDEMHTQTVRIPGNRLYFEATVLNFAYTLIQSGEAANIAIPTGIYSDQVPQMRAITLETSDEDGVPWSYLIPDEEIYGLEVATFREHAAELSNYFRDPGAARAAGIRSIVNQAVAQNLREGERREIVVQNTGGITIRSVRSGW